MRYAEVCAGISAATVAWHPLGWEAVFYSEIEKFPAQVLAHHYPDVPNLGDMNLINGAEYHGTIDILMGGTPCQSFSVAGLRAGLADPRGNLALKFLSIADRARPRWVVWENVPGVLSSNGGRDFGALIGGLAELGYGVAWRVLDAQYFGVAQRRRRVFLVGHLGDWRRATAVLFDTESLQGNSRPSRPAGATVAALTASGVGTCGADDNQGQSGHLIEWPAAVAPTLDAAFAHKYGQDRQHIECQGAGLFVFDAAQITSPQNMSRVEPGLPCPTLAKGSQVMVAGTCIFQPRYVRNGRGAPSDVAHALTSEPGASGKGDSQQCVSYQSVVRRITPIEAERLQGFPDNYTLINNRTADAPRYRAIGNSIAVPVLAWIGRRIQIVDKL